MCVCCVCVGVCVGKNKWDVVIQRFDKGARSHAGISSLCVFVCVHVRVCVVGT